MDNLSIPNESDFRRWIREAINEYLSEPSNLKALSPRSAQEEPLLTRKEVGDIFRISLVTLHDWMKRGLPCHKQRGRVYFLRSEVMAHVRKTNPPAISKAEV